MASGRYRGRVAERHDAATGTQLQRNFRKGAGCQQERKITALLLGLAGDAQTEPRRILSLHARDNPDLWLAGSAAHAERGRTEQRLSSPCSPCGGHARRRACLGLEVVCEDPREYSNTLTAVFVPEGHDADRLREIILENFDMSLGTGLSKLAGKVFRIGHLGSFNDLMLAGTLGGIEMGLQLAGVPHKPGGVAAALNSLVNNYRQAGPQNAVAEEAFSDRR